MSEGQLNKREYAGRPSVCRNCGALVGASETNCSLCGAPKNSVAAPQPQAPQPVYDHETVRFARALMTRPYIFTVIFIAANVFVFLLTLFSAGDVNDPLRFNAALIKYGAKVNDLINQGEWWRFVTPMFLHGGVFHILMNMYGLWMLGPYVERLYGSAKFVFFWVVTGVAGVVASYLSVRPGMHGTGPLARFLFKTDPDAIYRISVGASGALFGLIGVLFVFGIKFRHELPEGFKRAFGTGMLPMILINIFIGYAIPVIDNAAHMGGLVSGALLALVVGYKRPGEKAGVAVLWHVLQVLALALVAVSFLMVVRHFNKSYDEVAEALPPAARVNDSNLVAYLNALNSGDRTFNEALAKGDPGGIDEVIKQLEESKPPDKRATVLRDDLKTLLVRLRDFLAEPAAKRTKQQIKAEVSELSAALTDWEKKRDEWANNEGKNYGVYIETEPAKKDAK